MIDHWPDHRQRRAAASAGTLPRALVRVPAVGPADPGRLPPGFEVRGGDAVAATDDIDQALAQLRQLQVALDELAISTPALDDLFPQAHRTRITNHEPQKIPYGGGGAQS